MKRTAKIEGLFEEWIEELYDGEKQIVALLPKMVAASSSVELSTVLASCLEESKEQVSRFETLFERFAMEAGARENRPMTVLRDVSELLIGETEKSLALDIAIIAALRKVKHLEMAGYTSASLLAETLGQQDAYDFLFETLEEETEVDEALGEIAESLLSGEDEEEDSELEDEEEEAEEEAEEELR